MEVVGRSTIAGAEAGLPERALLERARRGSPSALEVLYHRHGTMVYAVARRFVGAADAEDVLQDVFVGLAEALARYDERGAFAAWLRRVTVRVSLMVLRRRATRSHESLDAAHAIRQRGPSADEKLALDEVIAALPSSLRSVFVLREIEGYTHAEIAELLGITRTASMLRHHRAWNHIRRFS
jgi:RNA polymerase sigma-70 factor (ECF subfamily)